MARLRDLVVLAEDFHALGATRRQSTVSRADQPGFADRALSIVTSSLLLHHVLLRSAAVYSSTATNVIEAVLMHREPVLRPLLANSLASLRPYQALEPQLSDLLEQIHLH